MKTQDPAQDLMDAMNQDAKNFDIRARKQWFEDHIGKYVYSCQDGCSISILIANKKEAHHLLDIEYVKHNGGRVYFTTEEEAKLSQKS